MLKFLKKKEREETGVSPERLEKDEVRLAYLDIYASKSIQRLFEFLISEYDKQISTLADFNFNPMSTPSSWTHYLNRKFMEMSKLKARKNLLVHFISKGKEFTESRKAEEWINKQG